jgi:hypothetical protein
VSPAAAEAKPDDHLSGTLAKAHAVRAKVARLKRDFDGAHRLAHEAQVREALTRTALSQGLREALIGRAAAEARVREKALQGYRASRGPGRLRRHNRLSQFIDRALSRLGPVGQAVVIARSGVWRGVGGPVRGLLQMMAYAARGPSAAAQPKSPFVQPWYLAAHPDLARLRRAPLVHYLVAGGREGRAPSPLFDPIWYARENAEELAATSATPLEHYVRAGIARGAAPHPLFDVAYYLAQDPALAPGEDVLTHYLREGARLGLSPHPLFDPGWYAAQVKGEGAEQGLLHYLAIGWREGLSPHPLFDVAWYLERYPETEGEPLSDFVAHGALVGRNPGPGFDVTAYAATRGPAAPVGVNPLVDYLQGGAWAVGETNPSLPTGGYIAAEPVQAGRGVTPLEHAARRGG